MAATPETLPRHELVGLAVRVRAGDNPDLVGIEGTVVTETTKTLGIEREGHSLSESRTESGNGADRVAQVPKAGTTFEFTLAREARSASEDASGDEPRAGEAVTVEGRRLVARPARRTEKSGDSKWR